MSLTKVADDSIEALATNRKPQESIVFVSGNFNTLHPGHVRLLNFAAECGDYLVVAVNGDNSPGVLFPRELRAQALKSLSIVDSVVLLNDDLETLLLRLKPDVVVKGKEHEARENCESKVLETYGGKLLFNSGDSTLSSIELLKRDFEGFNPSNIKLPTDYLARHKVKWSDLRIAVEQIKDLNVVVIGDTIVDEYITCDALGLSKEDPTIVVTPVLSNKFVGGAGIVASHAAGLGANVSFISVTGNDLCCEFAKEKLKDYKVDGVFIQDESRPTTLKQRFRTQEKTLLRVNQLRQHAISPDLIKKFSKEAKDRIAGADLLIFSDFNYGCLPQKLVDDLSEFCAEKNVKMVADSQSSSQVGDVSRFKHTLLMTPTEWEARLATRDFEAGLVVLAEELKKKAQARNVVITLGAEGVFILAEERDYPGVDNAYLTDKLSAFNHAPKDAAGAGDSFLVATSLALAAGENIWTSAYLGSLAAAIQVARVGNIPLSRTDILDEISSVEKK